MSAREIAENRLATGEITEEEFDRIISKIEQSEAANGRHRDRRPPPEYRSQEPDPRPRDHRPPERAHRDHRPDDDFRIEPNKQAPPAQDSSKGLGVFGSIIGVIFGLYIACCFLLAYAGAAETAGEKLYEVCTNRNHPFCRCQASNARGQMTFFKAPLLAFNIIAIESPADASRPLK